MEDSSHSARVQADPNGDNTPTPSVRPDGAGCGTAWLPLALVAAASFAVYVNAVANGLHVDDQYQIVTNPWITSFRNLPTVFSSGVWDFDGRISAYYRPMMYVLYSLVYAVAGTAPWAYHLLNILLHVGTSSVAFLVARALLGPQDAGCPWWRRPAFLAGLLFAVHPIHTEAVAWAACVVELSYSCFYLLAFYLVIRGAGRPKYVTAALASYAVALLSKEPAITLPAVLLVYWIFQEGREIGIRGLAKRLAPWVAVSAAYLLLRSLALGGIAPRVSAISLSPSGFVLTALSLFGRLLRAQVLPTELNFWPLFAPVESLWSGGAALALVTVGIWAGLFAWAAARRAVVPTVALAVAALPLTPTLLLRSLDQGLESAFAERYVYLSSFGVVLLAGWAVAALETAARPLARALSLALAALAVLGAAVTVQRNPVWKNPLSLWGDTVAKSPGSGVANLNYGFALMSAGQTEAGRPYVERGVILTPDLIQREMRRAVSYAQSGRSTDAILGFHRVLLMDPRSDEAHYNLGVIYEENGQTAAALREYRAAIALDPAAAEAHNNIGILYFMSGSRDQALTHLEEAVRLRPNDPSFRANLERARAR